MVRIAFTVLMIIALCSPVFGAGPGTSGSPAAPVSFYPQYGQGPEQQDRDRYECHCWAVRQTGFDPYLPPVSVPVQRAAVVPVPPAGHDTAVLGFTGALMGALAAGPRNAGAGALVGGVTGAVIGAVSDSARQERAREIEEAYNSRQQAQSSQLQRKGYDYSRAMSACLEGRGYGIR